MADHSEVAYTTADGNDNKEHEQTYLLFLAMVKWGIIFVVIVLILMAYFLVH
jgi:heme/copper-type cytochrome/quinol oxidase subunit 2